MNNNDFNRVKTEIKSEKTDLKEEKKFSGDFKSQIKTNDESYLNKIEAETDLNDEKLAKQFSLKDSDKQISFIQYAVINDEVFNLDTNNLPQYK